METRLRSPTRSHIGRQLTMAGNDSCSEKQQLNPTGSFWILFTKKNTWRRRWSSDVNIFLDDRRRSRVGNATSLAFSFRFETIAVTSASAVPESLTNARVGVERVSGNLTPARTNFLRQFTNVRFGGCLTSLIISLRIFCASFPVHLLAISAGWIAIDAKGWLAAGWTRHAWRHSSTVWNWLEFPWRWHFN